MWKNPLVRSSLIILFCLSLACGIIELIVGSLKCGATTLPVRGDMSNKIRGFCGSFLGTVKTVKVEWGFSSGFTLRRTPALSNLPTWTWFLVGVKRFDLKPFGKKMFAPFFMIELTTWSGAVSYTHLTLPTKRKTPHRTTKMRRRNLQAPGMEVLHLLNRQHSLQNNLKENKHS